MTEDKTLEEVLFDLLKRDFRMIFGHIQTVTETDESPTECVFVKLAKRNHIMSRAIEKEHLARGLLFWAKELDKTFEEEKDG